MVIYDKFKKRETKETLGDIIKGKKNRTNKERWYSSLG